MEEAVPTKSQKATVSHDILLVSATVITLSISANFCTAVTAIIMVTTVDVIIIVVIMESFASGTIGSMDMGVTPPSLDIAAISLKKRRSYEKDCSCTFCGALALARYRFCRITLR
jgi:hypothetical protein